jgi:hypothetical protein
LDSASQFVDKVLIGDNTQSETDVAIRIKTGALEPVVRMIEFLGTDASFVHRNLLNDEIDPGDLRFMIEADRATDLGLQRVVVLEF